MVGSLGIRASRPTGITEPGPNASCFCAESIEGRWNVSGKSGCVSECMDKVVLCGVSLFGPPVAALYPTGTRFCRPALPPHMGAEGIKFKLRGPPQLPIFVAGDGVMEGLFNSRGSPPGTRLFMRLLNCKLRRLSEPRLEAEDEGDLAHVAADVARIGVPVEVGGTLVLLVFPLFFCL